MKAKSKILAAEFKKQSSNSYLITVRFYRHHPLSPVVEINEMKFNYKFLMKIYPLKA